MFKVRSINDSDSVALGVAPTLEEARSIGESACRNGDIDEGDIIQIWSDEDENTAVEEFGCDEVL